MKSGGRRLWTVERRAPRQVQPRAPGCNDLNDFYAGPIQFVQLLCRTVAMIRKYQSDLFDRSETDEIETGPDEAATGRKYHDTSIQPCLIKQVMSTS